jgi:hypothetical protein
MRKSNNKGSLSSFPVEKEIKRRREFSDREVGLTHPDLTSFIRLNDQGDIEIFAIPGVGIIISGKSKSISFFADSIRFFTKEDGLRWNNYNFNYSASSFSEPTLVKIDYRQIHSAQNEANYYLNRISSIEEEEKQKPITILAENKFSSKKEAPEQVIISNDDVSDLSFEQIGLLEAYSSSFSREHIDRIISYLRKGLSFEEAHKEALKDANG